MNWEVTGAVVEIVGAIAVVASLVYLGQQIRFSNRLAQAEAWRSPISDINGLNATFGLDPIFRDAIFRVLGGATPDDLSSDESHLVEMFLISVFNCYEQLFREVNRGVLEQHALSEFGGGLLFELPFTRHRWIGMRERLGTPFVEYIEAMYDLQAGDGASGKDEHPPATPQ